MFSELGYLRCLSTNSNMKHVSAGEKPKKHFGQSELEVKGDKNIYV